MSFSTYRIFTGTCRTACFGGTVLSCAELEKKPLKKIGDERWVKELIKTYSPKKLALKFILVITAFLLPHSARQFTQSGAAKKSAAMVVMSWWRWTWAKVCWRRILNLRGSTGPNSWPMKTDGPAEQRPHRHRGFAASVFANAAYRWSWCG